MEEAINMEEAIRGFETDAIIKLSKPNKSGSDVSFTWIVFKGNAQFILHCYCYKLSGPQERLVEFAAINDSFISNLGRLLFLKSDNPKYIIMQKADVRLKEMLLAVRKNITIGDIAAILYDVLQALQALAEEEKLRYCSLDTSNIYISQNGKVQLASFDKDHNILAPEKLEDENNNPDCRLVGNLASLILPRKHSESENFVTACKCWGNIKQLANHAWFDKQKKTNGHLGRIVTYCIDSKLIRCRDLIQLA